MVSALHSEGDSSPLRGYSLQLVTHPGRRAGPRDSGSRSSDRPRTIQHSSERLRYGSPITGSCRGGPRSAASTACKLELVRPPHGHWTSLNHHHPDPCGWRGGDAGTRHVRERYRCRHPCPAVVNRWKATRAETVHGPANRAHLNVVATSGTAQSSSSSRNRDRSIESAIAL